MTKRNAKKYIVKKVFAGQLFGIISLPVLSLLLAMIVNSGIISIDEISIPLIIINIMAATAAGAITVAGEKDGRLTAAVISAVVFGLLVAITAFVVTDKLPDTAFLLRNLLCCVAGGILSAILDLGKSNKKLRKYNTKKI